MKKNLIWILIILIAASCAREKNQEHTAYGMWTDYYLLPSTLKGKVKQVQELNYRAIEKDGKLVKGELLSRKELDSIGSTNNTVIVFDEKGIPVKYDHLDMENLLNTRIAKIENGLCTGWEYKRGDSIWYYVRINYDNNGYPIMAQGFRPKLDTLVNTMEITHDIKGNFTRFEYKNYKGLRTSYNVLTPDNKGNITDVISYNDSDQIAWLWKNSYDEKGNMIRQEVVDKEGGKTQTWTYSDYKLDEAGNWTSYIADIDNGKFKIFVERVIQYY